MFPNNPVFSLLQQEGYLTRSSLYTGFSSLSKANINNNKGDFYVAFFQLSIGLERLMKLTLILDYMATNELRLPDNKWLKGFSHKLVELLQSVEIVEKRITERNLISSILQKGSFENELLNFLDDFAQKARYANLDTLTGKQNTSDPLERWSKLAKRIFDSDVHDEIKKELNSQNDFTSRMMSHNTVVMASDLEKNPLSFEQGLRQERMFNEVAPHAIWRIMKIVYPIYKVMDDVCGLAQNSNSTFYPEDMIVPTMYEFFIDFISNDKDYVLDLEQWLNNA